MTLLRACRLDLVSERGHLAPQHSNRFRTDIVKICKVGSNRHDVFCDASAAKGSSVYGYEYTGPVAR